MGKFTNKLSSKSNIKIEFLLEMTGSFVKDLYRAKRRELVPNSRVLLQFCADLILRILPFGSCLIYTTFPSCQPRSIQKSTKSPNFTSLLTRRCISLSSKLSLLLLYSSNSAPLSLPADTRPNMFLSSFEGMGSSSVTMCLHREQAFLCLRDSSMQGRQKAWPQGVKMGSKISYRQIGQFNFSSTNRQNLLSLSEPITVQPRLSFLPILVRTLSLKECRLILANFATAFLFCYRRNSQIYYYRSVSQAVCAAPPCCFLVSTIILRKEQLNIIDWNANRNVAYSYWESIKEIQAGLKGKQGLAWQWCFSRIIEQCRIISDDGNCTDIWASPSTSCSASGSASLLPTPWTRSWPQKDTAIPSISSTTSPPSLSKPTSTISKPTSTKISAIASHARSPTSPPCRWKAQEQSLSSDLWPSP